MWNDEKKTAAIATATRTSSGESGGSTTHRHRRRHRGCCGYRNKDGDGVRGGVPLIERPASTPTTRNLDPAVVITAVGEKKAIDEIAEELGKDGDTDDTATTTVAGEEEREENAGPKERKGSCTKRGSFGEVGDSDDTAGSTIAATTRLEEKENKGGRERGSLTSTHLSASSLSSTDNVSKGDAILSSSLDKVVAVAAAVHGGHVANSDNGEPREDEDHDEYRLDPLVAVSRESTTAGSELWSDPSPQNCKRQKRPQHEPQATQDHRSDRTEEEQKQAEEESCPDSNFRNVGLEMWEKVRAAWKQPQPPSSPSATAPTGTSAQNKDSIGHGCASASSSPRTNKQTGKEELELYSLNTAATFLSSVSSKIPGGRDHHQGNFKNNPTNSISTRSTSNGGGNNKSSHCWKLWSLRPRQFLRRRSREQEELVLSLQTQRQFTLAQPLPLSELINVYNQHIWKVKHKDDKED